MAVYEMSEVTGMQEVCTVRPGVLGADGRRYGAIPDIDLYGVFQDVITFKIQHSSGKVDISLRVGRAVKNAETGEMEIPFSPKDRIDKGFARKAHSLKKLVHQLNNKEHMERMRADKVKAYKEDNSLLSEDITDDPVILMNFFKLLLKEPKPLKKK